MKQKLLPLDFLKENTGLQIFPSKPLVSSEKTGWKDIKLESYQLFAHEMPEHVFKQNVIMMFHEPLVARRLLGGKIEDDCSEIGDIVVIPANTIHAAAWEEKASFTLLFVEPEFMDNVNFGVMEPGQGELMPCFSQQDPVIYGIGSYLKLQLESGEQVTQTYLDVAVSFLTVHLLTYYYLRRHNFGYLPFSGNKDKIRAWIPDIANQDCEGERSDC